MTWLVPLGQVVGVYSREVLLNAGNIHCITQQEPLGVNSRRGQPNSQN